MQQRYMELQARAMQQRGIYENQYLSYLGLARVPIAVPNDQVYGMNPDRELKLEIDPEMWQRVRDYAAGKGLWRGGRDLDL